MLYTFAAISLLMGLLNVAAYFILPRSFRDAGHLVVGIAFLIYPLLLPFMAPDPGSWLFVVVCAIASAWLDRGRPIGWLNLAAAWASTAYFVHLLLA